VAARGYASDLSDAQWALIARHIPPLNATDPPQGGVPILRTELESRIQWVSTIDVVTLLIELCTLIGELVMLGLTLWLLFAVWRHRDLFENTSAHEADPAASA
jgi:hypothetical protein